MGEGISAAKKRRLERDRLWFDLHQPMRMLLREAEPGEVAELTDGEMDDEDWADDDLTLLVLVCWFPADDGSRRGRMSKDVVCADRRRDQETLERRRLKGGQR